MSAIGGSCTAGRPKAGSAGRRVVSCLILPLVFCIAGLGGCGDPGRGRAGQATLKLAVLPVHDGRAMSDAYQPLLDHLSSETGYEVRYISSQDYDGFGAAVASSGAEVVLCDPLVFVTLRRTQGATALASGLPQDGGREDRGVIAVAAGSALTDPAQLRGKTIACVARRSAGGYLSQALALRAAGILLPDAARLVACGTMERAAALVRSGRADAAFLGRRTMAGADSSGLRVLAQGEPVPGWVCGSLDGADPDAAARVAEALLRLAPSNAEHSKLLARLDCARFGPPDQAGLDELAKQARSLAVPH